jgi:anti-sigma factor RsiW
VSDRRKASNAERLRRLLGPAAPELTCEACFELLDRYVELELDGRDADAAIPGMRAHLEGCPACREDHASLAALVADDRAARRPGWTNRG